MFRVRPRLLLACAILLLLPVRLPAQPATATLFVRIEDASGGRLPGATLTVRNQATAVERHAETTAEGTAAIPLLSAGDYRLAATLTGFRTAVIDRFHLEAGAVRTLRLVLQAGDVHETVQVTGDSAEIRAGSGAVGEIFSGQILTMTPVASRDVGEYAWQAPGVAPPAPGSRLSGEGGTPLNAAGAREASNNFLLDGVDNNDLFLNRVLVTPSLDAVQEFTLISNTYDAQYGRSAGAQVNVVLKSGSDRTTGSLYAFGRDRALQDRGFPIVVIGRKEGHRRVRRQGSQPEHRGRDGCRRAAVEGLLDEPRLVDAGQLGSIVGFVSARDDEECLRIGHIEPHPAARVVEQRPAAEELAELLRPGVPGHRSCQRPQSSSISAGQDGRPRA